MVFNSKAEKEKAEHVYNKYMEYIYGEYEKFDYESFFTDDEQMILKFMGGEADCGEDLEAVIDKSSLDPILLKTTNCPLIKEITETIEKAKDLSEVPIVKENILGLISPLFLVYYLNKDKFELYLSVVTDCETKDVVSKDEKSEKSTFIRLARYNLMGSFYKKMGKTADKRIETAITDKIYEAFKNLKDFNTSELGIFKQVVQEFSDIISPEKSKEMISKIDDQIKGNDLNSSVYRKVISDYVKDLDHWVCGIGAPFENEKDKDHYKGGKLNRIINKYPDLRNDEILFYSEDLSLTANVDKIALLENGFVMANSIQESCTFIPYKPAFSN